MSEKCPYCGSTDSDIEYVELHCVNCGEVFGVRSFFVPEAELLEAQKEIAELRRVNALLEEQLDEARSAQYETEREAEKPFVCPVCRGYGTMTRPPHFAGDLSMGGLWSASCPACAGKGLVWRK